MSEIITAAETAAWLKSHDNFLILTHRRPDGDTVGCAGALAEGLRLAGKNTYTLYNPDITPRYERFIEEFRAADGYQPDHVITVDTASASLLPKNAEKYAGSISLCIDHHPSNSSYAEFTCLDETSASCGEIIYEILLALSGSISAKSADCLYVAVTTDTGCFSFANTTANSLRVASCLIGAGAQHRKINKLLFRTKSRSRAMIESMMFSTLEYHYDGAVAISTITLGMMEKANAEEDDLDDISSLPGSVDGVVAGITIREMTSPQDCKISVRTMPPVNAHAISSRFGGGGHALAAGFSASRSALEIKDAIVEAIADFLPQAQ